jgi:hypothetical protein
VALGPLGLIVGGLVIGIGLLAAGAFLLIKNWQSVKNFFSNLGRLIVSFFVESASLLFNAGKALIGGLVNGLVAAKNAVVDTIKNIASGALDTVKKFFGIRSPSAVMAQQGKYLMQGLAKGITGNVSSVTGAMRNASEQVSMGFGSINGPDTSSLVRDVSRGIGGTDNSSATNIVINPNFSGIVARSRSEWREIGIDLIEAVNEELRSRGQAEIGGGKLVSNG